MSEPFRIRYNKARFPIQQKRADGTLGCRGCGELIPKGRQTWCSKACVDLFDPQRVLFHVKQRDKGICVKCGFDTKGAYQRWYADCRAKDIPRNCHLAKQLPSFPRAAQIDHIIPFSEGGLTVLENMRTLCEPCHKQRTKDWHRDRAQARKQAPAQLALLP